MRSSARSRIQSSVGLGIRDSLIPTPQDVPLQPQGLLDVEEMQRELSETESEEEMIEDKIKRDDLVNPFWIEDPDLKNGKRDFLSGHETQFWKDLIAKYLMPLIKDEEKEKKQARELIGNIIFHTGAGLDKKSGFSYIVRYEQILIVLSFVSSLLNQILVI